MKTWIIGCGHIGQRVNQVLQQTNTKVYAIARNNESACQLSDQGISTTIADLDDALSLKNLPFENSDIYYFAPPPSKGDKDLRMSNFLGNLNSRRPPRRIVYISTTGVYGNSNGKWINEATPPLPTNARSKRRLNAEQLIQSFCKNKITDYIILRVAGIYSEDKLPLSRIKAGLKVLKLDIAPTSNRIHSADLTHICTKSMHSSVSNQIFNVADGQPSSISDYFIQTAKLFDLPPPIEISWQQAKIELSPEMLSYLTESKKIDVSKMIELLHVTLLHPNLSAGLLACKKNT